MIILDCMDLDLAICIEQSLAFMIDSSIMGRRDVEWCDHSSQLSFMIMKHAILEIFTGDTSEEIDAKSFMDVIEKCFEKNVKAETSTLLVKFIWMRYKSNKNIQ